jgi:hypothetical protein
MKVFAGDARKDRFRQDDCGAHPIIDVQIHDETDVDPNGNDDLGVRSE